MGSAPNEAREAPLQLEYAPKLAGPGGNKRAGFYEKLKTRVREEPLVFGCASDHGNCGGKCRVRQRLWMAARLARSSLSMRW
jgi:hypothetical protein